MKKNINSILTILGIVLVIDSSIILENSFLPLILIIVGLDLVVFNVEK